MQKQLLVVLAFGIGFLILFQNSTRLTTERIMYVSNNPIAGEISLLQLRQLGCLNAGDKILFKRGSVFRGPLSFSLCNNVVNTESTVVISSYGTGDVPLILNSQNLGETALSWEPAKNIKIANKPVGYLANTPIHKIGPLTKAVHGLVYKSNHMQYASFPNITDSKSTQYFTINQFRNKQAGCPLETCLSLSPLEESNPTWILKEFGVPQKAFAIVRTSDWSFHKITLNQLVSASTHTIASQQGLNQPEVNGISVQGMGAILFGSLAYVTQGKEWFYDEQSKYLYFWGPNNEKPELSQTEVVYEGSGSALSVDLKSKANLVISHLRISNSEAQGLSVLNTKNTEMNSLEISNSLRNGMYVSGVQNLLVKGSVFRDNSANGFRTSSIPGDVRFYGNRFSKNGYFSTQTLAGMDFNNLRLGSASVVSIAGNKFEQSAYAQIMLAPANQSMHISQNNFKDFCLLLNDCGAIYINSKTQVLDQKMWIENNSFSGGFGNKNGARRKNRLSPSIYLDYAGHNFAIYGNSFAESLSEYGEVFLNGGHGNRVFQNRFFQDHDREIVLGRTHNPQIQLGDNEVYENFVIKPNGQRSPAQYNFRD